MARTAGKHPVKIELELRVKQQDKHRRQGCEVQKKPGQNLGGKRKKEARRNPFRRSGLLHLRICWVTLHRD